MTAHAPTTVRGQAAADRRARHAATEWLWLLGGLALAFALPFLFADRVGVQRDGYYALYSLVVLGLFALWLRAHDGIRRGLARNWRWGVGLGLVFAVPLVLVALREPSTPHPHGAAFAGAILWRGIVYGAADGVLLGAFPILCVFALFASRPLRERSRTAVAGIGALALAACLLFTAVYHLGYPDFRGGKLRKPVVGSVFWSAPTLLTLSPLGSPIAHVGLHVSAVVHSYQTDLFLPPHGTAATLERPGLQRVLDGLVADPNVAPGAVAAVITPAGTWRGSAGVADLATRAPATPDDWFRIASLTKTYTAVVVLQLVEEGKLRLSDTVGRLLPGVLPPTKAGITIDQLLSHTSGLNDSMNDAVNGLVANSQAYLATIHDPALRKEILRVASRRDPTTPLDPGFWVRISADRPLYFPPGHGIHYSSTGYVLLGRIAEKATGKPLAELMRERIFEPLGLKHTAYVPGASLPEPYAHGYTLRGGSNSFLYRRFPADSTRVTMGIAGGGAVAATAEDVARFYAAVVGGRLLAQRTLDERMLPESLGIGSMPTTCSAAYGHDGTLYGYVAIARTSADGKRAAVLLLNGRGTRTDAAAAAAMNRLFCGA